MIRYDVIFTGHVQGVFFRGTTYDIARGFEVAGWVRNQSDGTVRCVVEGRRDELERFVSAIQHARQGNIDTTTIRERTATGEFQGFEILRRRGRTISE